MEKLYATIIFDSVYGNTGKIANAIAEGMSYQIDVKVVPVKEATVEIMGQSELIVVGSPTHGGRPTAAMQKLLSSIGADDIRGVHFSAFDTRFRSTDHNPGLRLLLRVFGYAADRIEETLRSRGGILAISARGFYVEDREGPLKKGEIEKAREWGKALSIYMSQIEERILAVA